MFFCLVYLNPEGAKFWLIRPTDVDEVTYSNLKDEVKNLTIKDKEYIVIFDENDLDEDDFLKYDKYTYNSMRKLKEIFENNLPPTIKSLIFKHENCGCKCNNNTHAYVYEIFGSTTYLCCKCGMIKTGWSLLYKKGNFYDINIFIY